jgi:hypothetical protein
MQIKRSFAMAQVKLEPVSGLPRLWSSLLLCAVAAAWVDLGTIHRLHHSDSLIYALISLWQWTPFYWGQDRFGMLVPLVARAILHPLANLLFQDFLNIFGGLATFILLVRYVLRDASYPVVGLLGAATFLALVPPPYQAMYFIDACYGVWLALGLGGLIVARPPCDVLSTVRGACSLAMIILAHWVNFTSALVLGPLVVARWLFLGWTGRRDRGTGDSGVRNAVYALRAAAGSETAVALLYLAIGALAGRALIRLATARVATPLDAMAPYEWPAAWYNLLEKHWESLSPERLPGFLGCAAVFGVVSLAWRAVYRQAGTAWRAAAAMALSALVIWLYTGTRLWVRLNGYTYRYLMPSALLLEAAVLTVGIAPVCRAAGPMTRRALYALACAAVLGGAGLTYGLPSISGVRAELDRKCGALTEDLINARCTHLAGAYTRVWPAVFHANLTLYERGEDRTIWAITGRSEATEHRWRSVPPEDVRVAIPIGDREGLTQLREFEFPPLRPLGRHRTVEVFGLQNTPTAAQFRHPYAEQ